MLPPRLSLPFVDRLLHRREAERVLHEHIGVYLAGLTNEGWEEPKPNTRLLRQLLAKLGWRVEIKIAGGNDTPSAKKSCTLACEIGRVSACAAQEAFDVLELPSVATRL